MPDACSGKPSRGRADYIRYLADKGNVPAYVSCVNTRLTSLLDGCRFVRLADVQASVVLGFLADLRAKGKSLKTANDYLAGVKGFSRWLWRDKRTAVDQLAGMSKLANPETDVRHARRELSAEECSWLFSTVQKSDRPFRRLLGQDRFTLYLTAAGTGLRVSELASLTPDSFDLTAPPVVIVEASRTKNRKRAELPLPAELVDVLADYLAGKPADVPIWPGAWVKKAARMLRRDLADARKAWL